jgi:hypothetical protein
LNGFASGSDLPAVSLPGSPGCSREQTTDGKPLSAPITGASPLLQAGPPARAASVLSTSRFQPLRCAPPHQATRARAGDGSIGTRLPTFRTQAADQAHATSTPGTTWPVSGHPPGPSRDRIDTPVSMPFPKSRRVSSGSLAFVFLVPI